MTEKIQFKKQRELGAILGDTFKFIRLTWKDLFGLVFRIAGPALILVVVAAVFYTRSASTFDPIYGNTNPGAMFIWLIVMLFAGMVYYALLYGTILNFIKSYIETNGNPDKEAVKAGVRSNFWGLLGLSFLVSLMVGIGAIVCVAPGIYLGVVLLSTYSIYVFEKRDATDSISHSFNLIKNEWWITFATVLVIFILYYVIMMIFQIPQYLYFFIKNFIVNESLSADPNDMFDWGYIALSSIGVLGQYLMHSIIVICSSFIYFNLNEKKNFTGTMETIDAIGNRE